MNDNKTFDNKTSYTNHSEDEWKNLFVLTEHWQSDLKFFEDELEFFRSLIDRYFMRLIKEESIEQTRSTVTRLAKLENRRFIFAQRLTRHFNHIENLIENPLPNDAQFYRDEHIKLESAISDFLKDFRNTKDEIFQLAKQVMERERSSHLLKD